MVVWGQEAPQEGTDPSPSREPPTSLESVTTGDVGGVRNTTRGHRDSWDAALMMAASHGRPPSVRLLLPLEGGLFNNRKETALLLALQEGRVECKTPGGRGGSPRRGRKNAHRGDPKACSGVA
ncbi:Ankyrin repeat protein 1 [Giardia muris]|uniref:Ankyrin repeat protein 1 n=1 Tax=Giardia muris TaxID=5742 RepID=A0A4Z1SMW7_GIAMU|nr:Ankyrin repeat protein 1 [Giardia muris]|eukprot:TNJ26165.1 Ankyrin repeat protein 1 [Giardia muris]